jgi:hypothetical protein
MCCRLREWVADAEIAECHDVIPSQPEQLEHRNDSGFCREGSASAARRRSTCGHVVNVDVMAW